MRVTSLSWETKMKLKNYTLCSLVPRALSLFFALCVSIIFSGVTYAYSAGLHETDQQFNPGSLVALDENGQFGLANSAANQFTGVVARQSGTSFELISSGTAQVLVSDVDGKIRRGDRIGLSAVNGVASTHHSPRQDIGTALNDLSPISTGWKEATFAGNTFHIALLSVQLSKGAEVQKDSAITSIQLATEELLNKPVAMWRVITALITTLGGVLLAFFLVASASREAFLALGRNPLASPAVLSGLWKIVGVALLVVLSSLTVAYLIASTG